jgi:hypothetical protein
MSLLARLVPAVGLAILISPASGTENKRQEGERLIRQAEQLSDIRSDGAPAFRLKASFKGLGEDAPTEEGTYTEIWVSRGRWRRESILGTFRRTEVGGATRLWSLDGPRDMPGKTGELGPAMRIGEFHQEPIKVAAIKDQSVQGILARCVELDRGSVGKETLCIEPRSGVLLFKEDPNSMDG